MIKTLRITSAVAAILAGIFFVFPVVFGVRSDERVEEFLNLPSVREKFENAADNKAEKNESQVSPLVEQAKAFALYLNPLKPTIPKTPTRPKTVDIADELPVTPKFKVYGTSHCEGRPEMSLALIDEPGKGRHWVRQSSKVGHLLIEQVKDGLVIVKGSEGTFELVVEQTPQANLLEVVSPISARTGGRGRIKSAVPASGRIAGGVTRTMSEPPQIRRGTEEDTRLEELVDTLKGLQRSSKSDKTDSGPSDEERAARIEELISKFKSARVSAEEAKRLGSLGEKLKGIQGDPNQPAPITDKDGAEASSRRPNGSAGK